MLTLLLNATTCPALKFKSSSHETEVIADFAYSKTATATGSNSEVDRCFMKIPSQHNVAYVGPLAGYDAGARELAGQPVLVTTGPKWIDPKQGDWPTPVFPRLAQERKGFTSARSLESTAFAGIADTI